MVTNQARKTHSKDSALKQFIIRNCRFAAILLLLFTGCAGDDLPGDKPVNPDMGQQYPEGVEQLISAYNEGKTVSNILFIPASNMTGDLGQRWLITFTDATSINLLNTEGITIPYIRVSNEGYWTAAYDGMTFRNILDSNGEKIKALSEDFNADDPSQEEIELVNLSPFIDNSGKYYFNKYYASSPGYTVETIPTSLTLPKDMTVTGIIQNDYAATISFQLRDKGDLSFKYKNRWPYSFGILSEPDMLFSAPGKTKSLDFFVSPADVDFGLDGDNPLLELKLVYVNGDKAVNYSSYPVEISRISRLKDANGREMPGRYQVDLTDVGDNLFTYSEDVYLAIGYLGVGRENLSIPTKEFTLRYDSDSPMIIDSDIPVIKLYAPNAITSKDNWTDNCEIEVLNAGDDSAAYAKVQIKGRGNSTWVLPKKPYAIKLDKKEKVLGFPKHKRWVLLANYYDKTNLRNETAFFMGRMSKQQSEPGLDYTPRSSYARVFMNDRFQGLYQLTEQLKIDDNRVNVGDDGYLLEIDMRALEEPENVYFRVPHIGTYIVVKDPDIENQGDLDYIKNFMSKADNALFSDNFTDPQNGFRKYLDVNSFVDWYLINEITKNADSNFNTSCYMNLARGGKLKMGPLWDFDLAAGNYADFGDWWYTQWVNTPQDFHIRNVAWYDRMFQDKEFVKTVKTRFRYYYDRQNDIYSEIDRQRDYVRKVIEENEKVWFFFSKPFDREVSLKAYDNSCEELKSWLKQRFSWLKKEFDNM